MSSHSSFHLRTANAADEAFLEQLYCDAHVEEFRPMGLAEPEMKALLQMQFRAQRIGYANDFADAIDRIVTADSDSNVPIGRLLVATRRDAIHLVDIALVPAARGHGIGTTLVGQLLDQSHKSGLPVRLQVRPGNPAFQLYSRLGFRLTGGGMHLEMEFTPSAPAASDSLTPKEEDTLSDSHPIDQWLNLQGRSFRVMEVPPHEFPPLVLAKVERLAFTSAIAHSLIFHGPPDRLLEQSTYSLRLCHPETAEPLESPDRVLFLVPIGPVNHAMQYEAVFN